MTSKPSSLWALVILVLAAVAMGWIWLDSEVLNDEDVPGPSDLSSSTNSGEPHSPEPKAPNQASASVVTLPFQKPTSESSESPLKPTESITVRVLRGGPGGAPVPGAVVRTVDTWTASFRDWDREHGGHAEELEMFQKFGVRYVADENGTVEIARSDSKLRLHGQMGNAHAIDFLGAREQDVLVEKGTFLFLQEYIPIKVRVVGEDRKPQAGASVELAIEADGLWMATALCSTNSDGLALFHTALKVSDARYLKRYSAAVGVAATPRPRKPVTQAACDGAIIELVVPATSSCKAQVQFADGSSISGPAVLRLLEVEDPDNPKSSLKRMPQYPPVPVRNGEATLHYLTPGKPYALRLSSRLFGTVTKRFTAPANAETSELVIRLSHYLAGYLVRLVDANQQPIQTPEVRCTLRGLPDGPDRIEPLVSSDGRIFVELHPDSLVEPGTVSIEIVSQERRSRIITRGATFTAPLPAKGTIVDLGTCTLGPPEIFAAGSVLDSDSAPCPGAVVSIEPAQVEHRNLGAEDATTIIADQDGMWEHTGLSHSGEFLASAKTRTGHIGPKSSFPSGSLDVVLIVGSTASFSSTITLPSPNAYQAIKVSLEPTGAATNDPDQQIYATDNPAQLRFEATAIHPGPHRFRVTSSFDGKLLYEVIDLEIPKNGKTTHDVNLSDVFRALKLKVQDREGRAIPGASIRCSDPTAERDDFPTSARSNGEGEATVYTTRTTHRARVSAYGYTTRIDVSLPATSPIVLEALPRIILRSKSLDAIERPVVIMVRFIEQRTNSRGMVTTHKTGGQYARGQFESPKPNAESVELEVSLQRSHGRKAFRLPSKVIQIPQQSSDLTVQLEWPSHEVQEVVKKLRATR